MLLYIYTLYSANAYKNSYTTFPSKTYKHTPHPPTQRGPFRIYFLIPDLWGLFPQFHSLYLAAEWHPLPVPWGFLQEVAFLSLSLAVFVLVSRKHASRTQPKQNALAIWVLPNLLRMLSTLHTDLDRRLQSKLRFNLRITSWLYVSPRKMKMPRIRNKSPINVKEYKEHKVYSSC